MTISMMNVYIIMGLRKVISHTMNDHELEHKQQQAFKNKNPTPCPNKCHFDCHKALH